MRWTKATLLPALLILSAGCGGERAGGVPAADDRQAAGPATDWPLPAATPGTGAPDLSVAADGRILLSWVDSRPGRRHLFRFSAWSTQQQRWQHAPATIALGNRMVVDPVDPPHIAATLDGAIWAHWLQRAGTAADAHDVALVRSRDGANWSSPLVPHRDRGDGAHGFVSMWPHGTDLLGIAWIGGRRSDGVDDTDPARADGSALRAALLDPAHERVLEAVVDTRVCDRCATSVALGSRGPLLFYRGRSPDEVRDILVTRLDGNVWTAPRRVHRDDWTVDDARGGGPSADAHGADVVVGWYTAPGDAPELRLARSDDAGDSFGEPRVLDRGAALRGRVAVDLDADRTRVLWLREEEDGQVLWYAQLAPDLSREYGRMALARVPVGHDIGLPRLVAHAGTAYAVWTDQVDGSPQLRGVQLPAGAAGD